MDAYLSFGMPSLEKAPEWLCLVERPHLLLTSRAFLSRVFRLASPLLTLQSQLPSHWLLAIRPQRLRFTGTFLSLNTRRTTRFHILILNLTRTYIYAQPK